MVNKLDTKLGNYELVKYNPEFKSQILELQKHLWGSNVALNAAYFEWKYDNNPYLDTTLIYVVLCDGQIIGMIGVYGAKWQSGVPGQLLIVPCLGDLVIHPDHRNRGLSSKLITFAIDDITNTNYTYVFDLSAVSEVTLGLLMMGWRSIDFLQTAYWQSNQRRNFYRLRKYAHKLFHRYSDQQGHPFDILDRNGFPGSSNTNPHVVVERIPRPETMAELAERVGNDGCIRHIRDKQFFTWRFQNPLSQFRFLFWDDVHLEGYLVLQTSVHSHDSKVCVNVVDWEATNVQVWAGLLQAAICWGNFNKITIWSATLSNEAKAILNKLGFNFLDKTGIITSDIHHPTILIKSLREEMLPADWILANRRLLDLTNWDLRMIYSDNY